MAHRLTWPHATYSHGKNPPPRPKAEVIGPDWFKQRVTTLATFAAAWLVVLTGAVFLSGRAGGIW